VKIKARVATINIGTQTVKTVFETLNSQTISEGIQTTASALNVFEPKIFHKAIECFQAIAALTDIINSGKLVQIATANIVIIADGTHNKSHKFVTDSTVYLAQINIHKVPKNIYANQIGSTFFIVLWFSEDFVLSDSV
jgi:hypothetical protein